jgi:hypothetical protein
VADDLRLGGVFLEDGEEVAGKTHFGLPCKGSRVS